LWPHWARSILGSPFLGRQFTSTDAGYSISRRCTRPDIVSSMFKLSTNPRAFMSSALLLRASCCKPLDPSCGLHRTKWPQLQSTIPGSLKGTFEINIVMHACLLHAANREGIASFNLATPLSSMGTDSSVARHLVPLPKLNASYMRRERRSWFGLESTGIKRVRLSPHLLTF
jgi:hypothetical protein